MIDVVSGVMIRDGRVFLTQRRADQSYPFLHETPGGKVEEGEDLREALTRELGEELFCFGNGAFTVDGQWTVLSDSLHVWGVAKEPVFVAEFGAGTVDREERAVRISFFLVDLHEKNWPTGAEGQGSGWFGIPEMRALRMLPGNEQARSIIEREIVREGARK